MPEPTLDWWAERILKGTEVRVVSDEYEYEGWAHVWDHDEPAIHLYDAKRDDGEQFESVTVHSPTAVEELGETNPIEVVDLDKIRPSPYSVRKDDTLSDLGPITESANKIREIHLSRNLFSYPYVRPVGSDEYELISGHRRTAIARYARLETLPVKVFDLDDWEAVERFVYEHFPFPSQRPEQPDEFYSDDEIAESLERLRERWSDEKLAELPQLRDLVEE